MLRTAMVLALLGAVALPAYGQTRVFSSPGWRCLSCRLFLCCGSGPHRRCPLQLI